MKTVVRSSLFLALSGFVLWSETTSKSIAVDVVPAAKVKASEIGNGIIILGDLGHPIGEDLTIHGTKTTNGPGIEFRVDKVNNQILDRSMGITIDGIDQWPDGTEATMRGYEVGTIRYLHLEDTNFGSNDPRYKLHQTIFLSFRPTKILEPKGLKIAPRR